MALTNLLPPAANGAPIGKGSERNGTAGCGLGRTGQHLNEAQTSPGLCGGDRVKVVIEIRARLIAQIVLLNSAIAVDPRLQAAPDQARAFADRLTALRMKLAGLQAKWRSSELTEKFEIYAMESRPVVQAIADFVHWARTARRAA